MLYYTAGDYDSRFRGTYIGRTVQGKVIPYFVERVTDDPIVIHARVVQEDGTRGERVGIPVEDPSLILHPPKLGLVQNGGELFYIRRRPHRRWKQGLALDSCNIRWYVRDRMSEEIGTNVYKVFNPERTPLDEALRSAFEVPRRAYAITASVGVVPSTDEVRCHVVHKTRKIGEYNRETEALEVLPSFTALHDTMRRAGFNNVEVQDG